MKKKRKDHKIKKPVLSLPVIPLEVQSFAIPQKVEVYEFYTIADGIQRIFKDEDGIQELGVQVILSPYSLSFTNLFINGVLQPKDSYLVEKGKFCLLTEDVPLKGTLLILQMVKA
ncbi:DUF4183 domain-containing protein [Niallia sp. NCCP-28]|uniref:DUF4183 domain-containing protein n=1 Tax=Niallia sp. NCCP-28 TaxID=2934712 RepID=UPI00208AD7D9|nr:DUF4183 domain-containing protein [Niallia sp. NCCP-28]GKU84366.1 hypothetical protein NCCP28_37620 [Niallia sp. NCCP-28]